MIKKYICVFCHTKMEREEKEGWKCYRCGGPVEVIKNDN